MAASKVRGVGNQLVHAQPDGCVVRGNYRAGAHANERIDWNTATDELSEQPSMSSAAKTSCAEHDAELNLILHLLQHFTINRAIDSNRTFSSGCFPSRCR